MATVTVNSATALLAAIGSASNGDTILLAPGVYSRIVIQNVHFTDNVTIASLDPGNPAVLNGLYVNASSGLTFSNMEGFSAPDGSIYQYQILSSSDIHLSNMDFYSTADRDVITDNIGLRLKWCEDISVTDSEFHDLDAGIHMGANDGVSIVGNEFYDIRKDGMQDTVGSSNVLISQNYFHDFNHLEGDHSDAMQFGTYNATSSPTNIVITDNVIMQGSGTNLQGIFMGNEKSIPYVNVTITGNFIYDGHYHGITVVMADGIVVQDNTVVSDPLYKTAINVKLSTNAVLTGNEAIQTSLNGTNITTNGNTYVAAVMDGGHAAFDAWMADNGAGLLALPDSLRIVSDPAEAQATTVLLSAGTLSFSGLTDTGVSNSDNITNDATFDLALSGQTAGTAVAYQLSRDGGQTWLSTTAAQANILDGTYLFRAQVGLSGSTATSGAISVTIDHTAPSAGSLNLLDFEDTGTSATDRITTDTSFTLSLAGGELGAAVAYQVSLDGGLTWQNTGVAQSNLGIGNYQFRAISTDAAGNQAATGALGVGIEAGAPVLPTLSGTAGADTINGTANAERIDGLAGNDTLRGGSGDDLIYGGDGNDSLTGGNGKDSLWGGLGGDKFVFDAAFLANKMVDTIADFNAAQGDKISVAGIDAKTTTMRDDAFTFIGTSDFSGKAGQLHYEVKDGNTYVSGDVNGDKAADFTICLLGIKTLVSTDFLL